MSALPNTQRLAAARDRWVAAGTVGRPTDVDEGMAILAAAVGEATR